ncbi:hypothetical protein [Chloracidobacterium thermophilum]|uniref:hypothetical protein n=1 Tax=Chloracidobacterium thermophilum TaxID=458033 RepID=UPI0007399302|nr:hypothetical protein [Chloracidobacterium thermophilum]
MNPSSVRKFSIRTCCIYGVVPGIILFSSILFLPRLLSEIRAENFYLPFFSQSPSPNDNPIVDFSRLDQEFRILSLAGDIAVNIQDLPPAEQSSRIRSMPSGLRMFILWSLPEDRIRRLWDHTHAKKKEEYPAYAAEIESISHKTVDLTPLMCASIRNRQLNFQITQMMVSRLTLKEQMVAGKVDVTSDLSLSGAYIPLMGYLSISPKGWKFLHLIFDDGFLCAREESENP